MIQESINQTLSLSSLLLATNPAFQEYRKMKGLEKTAKQADKRIEALANMNEEIKKLPAWEEQMEKATQTGLDFSEARFQKDPTAKNLQKLQQDIYSAESMEETRQWEAAQRQAEVEKEQKRREEIEYSKGIEEENRQRARREREMAEKAARMGLGFSAADYQAAPSLLKKTLGGF